MCARPLHIGPSEVAEVFQQQQLESGNSKPFSIEAGCVECNEACAAVNVSSDIDIRQVDRTETWLRISMLLWNYRSFITTKS